MYKSNTTRWKPCILCCLTTHPQNEGRGGGTYLRGVLILNFWSIGGALIRRGRLFKRVLIREFMVVTLQFSFEFGSLNKGRHCSRTIQIIVLAYQLVHTNWLLNHLAQQMIETLGHVPFWAHWVHVGSHLSDKLGELSGLQTPSNSQELFPFHGQQEQSLPDVGYSARVDRDLWASIHGLCK